MKDINLLLPKVKEMANTFLSECKKQGYDVIITSTYRDEKEQNALYAQGRTTPGNVVTNARFGDSLHNYKVALDFAPVVKGKIPWNDKALFTKIGEIGERCGFEWGGRWTSFLDMPHLQFTAGYTLNDFKKGKVDYSKFENKPQHFVNFQKALKEFQEAEGIKPFPLVGNQTKNALNKYLDVKYT